MVTMILWWVMIYSVLEERSSMRMKQMIVGCLS